MKNLFYVLLIFSILFNPSCDEENVHGCVDSQACNYNSQATIDNNSCIYEVDACGNCGGSGPLQGFDCNGNELHQIGENLGGGILFYLDESGLNGLIAATEDLNINYPFSLNEFQWGCSGVEVYGADGNANGYGYQNTMDILNYGCESTDGSVIAAQAAYDAEINDYNDWYLPSKDELSQMINNIGYYSGNEGSFNPNSIYLSSSEINSNYISIHGSIGGGYSGDKFTFRKVRPIRSINF